MTQKDATSQAYELLTPNMQAEIYSAEGSEAEEMQELWLIIGRACNAFYPMLEALKTMRDEYNEGGSGYITIDENSVLEAIKLAEEK